MQAQRIRATFRIGGLPRSAWRAFWVSRAAVWAAGLIALAAGGRLDASAERYDATGLTEPFGTAGDALVAPAARWDSVWFLAIADSGYDEQRAAFFPLYPLLSEAAGVLTGSALVGGLLVSVAAFLVALLLLYRLVELDWGAEAAALTVALVALFPTAFFFTAVYSEALFLALSVGAVYAARTGRWAWAGALGGLGAATRSAGVILLVPLAIMAWRGVRRGDVSPRTAAWLALVPGGLGAFCLLLAASGLDPFAMFRAQEVWDRSFAGPLGAVPAGASAAWDALDEVGRAGPLGGLERANLDQFAFLLAAVPALVLAVRRLPLAYWAYALAALALPLSFPTEQQPLMSLSRFLAVLWPLHLGVALWLVGRGRAARVAVLGLGALGLVVYSAAFATWRWVA